MCATENEGTVKLRVAAMGSGAQRWHHCIYIES